ncbi:MAG TPA: shikimate dehydrogenase, partial [Thermopetrobacter sp.]|nr:shikimate dehydrogenase [Thermopetrobacter sp.]
MSEPIKAGVIGWPVAHSRSPLIHRHWLSRHGIDGRYERIPVRPEELEGFLATLADRGLSGCNVTVPLKEQAHDIVARTNPSGLTDTARRLRAVNTIWLQDGAIHADNTDAYGFMASFRQHRPDWRAAGRSVLVIGAGGAARAVVAALLDAGVKTVTVANRTLAKAETLAREMGGPVTPLPLSDLPRELSDSDVLVNTTTLGMTGQPPLD